MQLSRLTTSQFDQRCSVCVPRIVMNVQLREPMSIFSISIEGWQRTDPLL